MLRSTKELDRFGSHNRVIFYKLATRLYFSTRYRTSQIENSYVPVTNIR